MPIIDAHSHIFPEKIAVKATESIGNFYAQPMVDVGCVEALLQSANRAGVDRVLVCSTATKATQVESINRFIAAAVHEHPVFFGLGTMIPGYEHIEQELDRCLELGLIGVKLHPDFQAFHIDDEAAFPIYAAAQERQMPILFHTGDHRYSYSKPERMARVAKLFPKLTCIAAHFGGWSEWDQLDAYEGIENVVFDTSSTFGFREDPAYFASLVRRFGAERFMFGVDFPMWEHESELARFYKLPLTDEEREQLLYKTAMRVFGFHS